jgi:hypothetical protein
VKFIIINYKRLSLERGEEKREREKRRKGGAVWLNKHLVVARRVSFCCP